MLLSELEAIVKEQRKLAKKAGVDPEVRFLVLPNFPTALSIRSEAVSSLDLSLSKEARGQGNFIYLAEAKDVGPVYGDFTERFGWDKPAWQPTDEAPVEDEDANAAIVAEETNDG